MSLTLAHLSDTHLGYVALGATEFGKNQRELDMLAAFRATLDSIASRNPDLVVHSGDFFDKFRPSNFSIIEAYRALTDFQRKQDGKPFVIVAGNHDTPRSSDQGQILALFRNIDGVYVEAGAAKMLDFPSLDCEILCLPDQSIKAREKVDWSPTGARRHAILAAHGMCSGIDSQIDRNGQADFEADDLRPTRWTYVALGDYHTHRVFAPNACYSGSTEYSSSNFWKETNSPKGWVWFDSEIGNLEFAKVEPRPAFDLKPISAKGKSAEDLEAELVASARWPESAKPALVRQRVFDAVPEIWSRVGFGWKREVASRCLHYALEVRPTYAEAKDGDGAPAAPTTRTVEQEWADRIAAAVIPFGVDRAVVCQLGEELLEEVQRDEAVTAEA